MKSKTVRYSAALHILAACMSICLILNLTAFYARCECLRADFLRLHIVAASDDPHDQQLKLKVRDAVLRVGAELFDGSVSAEHAEETILPEIDKLKAAADRVLRENGCGDGVTITVQKEFFPARQYGTDMTLPAGIYEAVRVVIGEGKGQNWWCVMFPPMCLPAAEPFQADAAFSQEEQAILKNPTRYKAKLKIVEWIQSVAEKIDR